MSDQYAEQYKKFQLAKKLEQMGSNEKALDLYLDLHKNYAPNTSDAFERPIILLKKVKRYEEALALCHQANGLIEEDKISGTQDKFNKHIEFIESKMKAIGQKVDIKQSAYNFGVIGFRSKKKNKMLISTAFYMLFIALGLLIKSFYLSIALITSVYLVTYFADSIQVKTSKNKKRLIVILLIVSTGLTLFSFLKTPQAFVEAFNLESTDPESKLKNGADLFKTHETLPLISESNIRNAINGLKINVEVYDAVILVSGNHIAFGIMLNGASNEDAVIRLAEDFVDSLAHLVAKDQSLKRPTATDHGELYDFYDIIITAGLDDQTILLKGKKDSQSKWITWLE